MKNNTHKQLSDATIAFFVFLTTCCISVLCFALLRPHFFDGYSQMNDFIIDQIILQGTNKTGEWSFFWLMLGAGCVLILLFYLFTANLFPSSQVQDVSDIFLKIDSSNRGLYLYGGMLCLAPACFQSILYGAFPRSFWCFGILFALFVWILRDSALMHIALFLCLYFDLLLMNTLKGLFTHTVIDDQWIFLALSLCYIATLTFFKLRKKQFPQISDQTFYVVQLPLPLLLLVYLKSSYQTPANLIALKQPALFTAAIVALIIVLFGLTIRFVMRGQRGLCISSAISIFLFGSYMPAARFVPSDLHHHGEQLLPLTELLKFHSMPYQDFSPVSGLYPLPIGALNLLLGDTATTYSFAFVLFMIVFACLTIICIRGHVNGYYTFLFAFLFHMPAYCRTWILLPTLLILFLPAVRKNPGRFLFLYIGLSFLNGLYYPLFGFALLCGLLPYALFQFISYCKLKQYKQDINTPSFYCKLVALIMPILICLPTLFLMAKHVVAYSSQTLLGDGLTIKGRDIPEWFLPYVTNSALKEWLYECSRFIGPMLPIWLLLICILCYIKNHYQRTASLTDNIFHMLQKPYFAGLVCALILLPLTYTYTLVIMDEDWVSRLASRSGHVALWLSLFVCILFLTADGTKQARPARMLLCSLFISIALLSFPTMRYYAFPTLDGATNLDSESLGAYSINALPFPVSDAYQTISADDMTTFAKLGSGFMLSAHMSQLYDYHTALATVRKYDPALTIMGLSPYQLYYYLLDEKAPYTGKLSLAKSQKASMEAIKKIDAHTAFGSDLRPLHNYYIYNYLLTHGYAYDETTQLFVPSKTFASMHPNDSVKASLQNSPWSASLYLNKCATTLGHNLDALSNHLTKVDAKPASNVAMLAVQIDTDKLGNISPDSYLMLTWGGTGNLILDLDDGSWLIPLCVNADYATGDYGQLFISMFDPQTQTTSSAIPLDEVCTSMQYYAIQP